MKMMIAVLEERFLNELTEKLLDNNVRITKLHSTGGFLSKGNCTLLLGAEKEKVPEIRRIFEEIVKPYEVHEEKGDFLVQGANLFVIDVEKGFKI
ncbi:MAG: cyclic-di-AMP receptor [Tissierellia bacterium]|nr:cyclic-di-AMP receptor [Tissierellia bacterium]